MTAPLSTQEFAAMERLMAYLLPHCDAQEEEALLMLHRRLTALFNRQTAERQSRDRLRALSNLKSVDHG